MMRALIPAILILCLSACGGSSPSSPGPTPPTTNPPAAQTWALAGAVVDAMTGNPIAGASLAFTTLNQTQTSGGDGGWSVTGSGTATTRQVVTVSAAGYQTYETGIRWEQTGRRDIRLALIPARAPFSLTFYRELVRDALQSPTGLRPLARWTTTPNFYINTFNPKTGQPIEPAELALTIQSIRAAVPQLTGGLFSAGVIESGNGAVAPRRDYIDVTFTYEPTGDYCGRAFVAANPGAITINYDRCAVVCGSLKVTPEAIIHEVGHAMGFWHTTALGVMKATAGNSCSNTTFTPDEQLHAKLAYMRPPGNLDLDRDPTGFSNVVAERSPEVICRR